MSNFKACSTAQLYKELNKVFYKLYAENVSTETCNLSRWYKTAFECIAKHGTSPTGWRDTAVDIFSSNEPARLALDFFRWYKANQDDYVSIMNLMRLNALMKV